MILAGVLWGAANGNLNAVTQSLIDSAGDAVSLALTMLGIMSFWCGVLQIGMNAGLIDWLTKKMGPVLDFLFPDVKESHPARKPLAVNLAANLLGAGMAATPAGLEAMKALSEGNRQEASNAMCTFLILNVSSLQLIPVSMIAYRSQYHSAAPAAVAGPALIATGCSTLAAVIFCKIAEWLSGRKSL